MKFKNWLESVNVQEIAKKSHLDISKFDLKQVVAGYNVELEHGKRNKSTNVTNDDPLMTLKIAVAHLNEDPNYYKKLKKVETS